MVGKSKAADNQEANDNGKRAAQPLGNSGQAKSGAGDF
jgi:hypothetical protein